jgi:CHASE2 domain-containing sensor protein
VNKLAWTMLTLDAICWIALFTILLYNGWWVAMIPVLILFIFYSSWCVARIEKVD